MEKEFIPYEQALALKELGFDEDGLGMYSKNGSVLPLVPYTSEDKAILFSQAFRWLLTLVNKDKLFSNKWTISYNEDYYSLFLGGCNMGVFEAELECLKKLIELVKNK